MPRKPLQTTQEKLLYASSLLGIEDSLSLIEDKIKSNCNSKDDSGTKDDSNVIPLRKVK